MAKDRVILVDGDLTVHLRELDDGEFSVESNGSTSLLGVKERVRVIPEILNVYYSDGGGHRVPCLFYGLRGVGREHYEDLARTVVAAIRSAQPSHG